MASNTKLGNLSCENSLSLSILWLNLKQVDVGGEEAKKEACPDHGTTPVSQRHPEAFIKILAYLVGVKLFKYQILSASYVLDTKHFTIINSFNPPSNPVKAALTVSLFYRREDTGREVKQLAQSHTAKTWRGWALTPASALPGSPCLSLCPEEPLHRAGAGGGGVSHFTSKEAVPTVLICFVSQMSMRWTGATLLPRPQGLVPLRPTKKRAGSTHWIPSSSPLSP